MMMRLPRLPARHRAWVTAKVLMAVWLVVYAIVTPPATSAILGAFVWVWVAVSVTGLAVSIAGMYLALRVGRLRSGRLIEMSGLILAVSGPGIHALTLTWITVPLLIDGQDWTGRVGPLMQSVVIAAFLVVRFVEVRTRVEVI